MKKMFCTVLAVLMVLGCMFAFTGCNGNKPTTSQKPAIPAGYVEYNDGNISFAYPQAWTKTDGSVTVLAGTNGNNVTVTYEAKTDMYENMTIETFISTMVPAFSMMGLSVSNISIVKAKVNNVDVVKMAFTTSASGVSMSQTIYCVNVAERTYSVTVTEVQKDAALVSNVYNTLYVVK